MAAFERVRLVLLRADTASIGCHFWSEAEYGVPVSQLQVLGLVRPIQTQIPRCEDHGCHLIQTCAQRIIFAEGRPGRAGRKFHLSDRGRETLESPERLRERLEEHPLVPQILASLADGPLSWPDMYWRLFEPRIATLAEGRDYPHDVSRPIVRFCLDLLTAAGLVEEDEREGTVRLVRS